MQYICLFGWLAHSQFREAPVKTVLSISVHEGALCYKLVGHRVESH
jgi:hypothetical protein